MLETNSPTMINLTIKKQPSQFLRKVFISENENSIA